MDTKWYDVICIAWTTRKPFFLRAQRERRARNIVQTNDLSINVFKSVADLDVMLDDIARKMDN